MSDGPRLEVAEVFRQYAEEYLVKYGASPDQRRVLRDVQDCRTAILGGHVEQCDGCGHQKISYNSCRNRHCPKCQGPARAQWMRAREAELLPVPYFHVVFTLPEILGPLALQNKAVVYDAFFLAVGQTLLEVAANPKRLGARIGFLTVLHTWGQNLMYHPHIHCVVPSGGLSMDGTAWVPGRADFFLPVRILSRVFRGKFIALLKQAYRNGALEFHGRLTPLVNPDAMEELLNQSVKHDWVVYAKRPFSGPQTVLKYLARYTHRVAISNGRLLRLEDGRVTFGWRDYAHGNRRSTMTLEATEFIRRFLLHVLPSGFMRIRYYGFMSNRYRRDKLAHCRELLAHLQSDPQIAEVDGPLDEQTQPPTDDASDEISPERCPVCREGTMRPVGRFGKQYSFGRTRDPPHPAVAYCDTS